MQQQPQQQQPQQQQQQQAQQDKNTDSILKGLEATGELPMEILDTCK